MISYSSDEDYRAEILKFFKRNDYDEDILTERMNELYEKIKDIPMFREKMVNAAACFLSNDPEVGLSVLFSYDHFPKFHQLLDEHKIKLSW
jgi:hypothetical protein